MMPGTCSADARVEARPFREGAGRLVVVSNRVADPDHDRKAGGLAVAVGEALAAAGGIWFGWSGTIVEAAEETPPVQRRRGNVDLVTLDLTPEEHRGYYQGFANQCLWPLFHYRSDLMRFDDGFLDSYRRVNRRFAHELALLLEPEDTVWVQDFHLLPLGAELRRRGVRQPIGFFLHVPFPPTEVVATLPGHRDLLGALLAYDLVGFQTENDAACFRAYAERELGAVQRAGGSLVIQDRIVRVGAFPVGIDPAGFARLSDSARARRQISLLRTELSGRSLIVGVDRLDYSKGLPHRFQAYRRFLERYPENRSRVVLTQVAPPSRERLEAFAQIRHELDQLEGAINGQFAEFDWTPVRYIRRPLAREKLAALYRASRVALVTPLRDGMNLVAKEFVAAQDADDPGVLVLSCFAGAAETLRDAIVVNPYDINQTADAIRQALQMPRSERRERHAVLQAAIRRHDVFAWQSSFLATLRRVAASVRTAEPAGRSVRPTTARPRSLAPAATGG